VQTCQPPISDQCSPQRKKNIGHSKSQLFASIAAIYIVSSSEQWQQIGYFKDVPLSRYRATDMSKVNVKTTFEASRTLRPIYTGGSSSLDASGRLLVTCVREDALIIDLKTGDQLASLEGVSLRPL
jgi:hypothetical protein